MAPLACPGFDVKFSAASVVVPYDFPWLATTPTELVQHST
jgi:hypothetical protein